MSKWKSKDILVSICCITYNHEKFISEALDSFLMQVTNFAFEIIVGEDCSTDNTLNIIKNYQRSYPDIIKLVDRNANVGMNKNLINTFKKCNGKYIAFCEGDDYWTDPLKLQKQVDFLEQNPKYVICYTGVKAISEDGDFIEDYLGGTTRDLTSYEMKTVSPINTLTVLFRNIITSFPREFNVTKYPDLFMWVLLSEYGDGKYLGDIKPSIYRIHSGGTHSGTDQVVREQNSLCSIVLMYSYCSKRFNDIDVENAYFNKIIGHIQYNGIVGSVFSYLKSYGYMDVFDDVLVRALKAYSETSKETIGTKQKLASTNSELERIKLELKNVLIELDSHKYEVSKIYDSFGWKILGPYRRLKRYINQKFISVKEKAVDSGILESNSVGLETDTYISKLKNYDNNYFNENKSLSDRNLDFEKDYWRYFEAGDINTMYDFLKHNEELVNQFFNDCNISASISEITNAEELLKVYQRSYVIDVVVTSYNHQRYISQALTSVINQEGFFALNILIADDCSPDSTKQIISNIIDTMDYNCKISILDRPHNMGMLKNLKNAFQSCSGNYIAICEGDDYWISNKKLQKQLSFILRNANLAMCFNRVLLDLDNDNSIIPHPCQSQLSLQRYNFDFLLGNPVTANFSCCMYKTEFVRKVPDIYYENKNNADWLFNLYMASYGDVGYLQDILSLYRVHSAGQWSSLSEKDKYYAMQSFYKNFLDLFPDKQNEIAKYIVAN
ncbi:glycosyltransferase [Francisella philomiragia]